MHLLPVCTGLFQFCHRSLEAWPLPNAPLCLLLAQVVAQKLGLYPELLGYFGLFLLQCFPEGKLSGKMERWSKQDGQV